MNTPATTIPEQSPVNILFLCAHNRVRSLLAEALLNHLGHGRFKAYSAGISPDPDGQPHPMTLEALQHAGVPTDGLHSKGWHIFSAPDAPHMDLVVTVCDETAGETNPDWPGHPTSAHWHYPDLSEVTGDEEAQHRAFQQSLHLLGHRMQMLLSIPPNKLAASFQP